MVYNLSFFSLQNAVYFIILTYLVPVLFTFYIQGVLKLKKNSGVKMLMFARQVSVKNSNIARHDRTTDGLVAQSTAQRRRGFNPPTPHPPTQTHTKVVFTLLC